MFAPGARMASVPAFRPSGPPTSLARTSMGMAATVFWITSALSSPANGTPPGNAGFATPRTVSAVAMPPFEEVTRTKAGGIAPAAASNVTSARSVVEAVRVAVGYPASESEAGGMGERASRLPCRWSSRPRSGCRRRRRPT